MEKRKYIHVQMLLEIEAKIAAGKTKREVAEQFGFKDQYAVKRLLKRQKEAAQTATWKAGQRAERRSLKL